MFWDVNMSEKRNQIHGMNKHNKHFRPKKHHFWHQKSTYSTLAKQQHTNKPTGRKKMVILHSETTQNRQMKRTESPTRLFDIVDMNQRKRRRPCFRYGATEVKADEYRRQAELLSYALLARGLKRNETVILVSDNRPEWNIIDIAVMQAGGILLPLCKGLTAEEYLECIRQSGARIMFVENDSFFRRFKLLLPQMENIDTVVFIDGAGPLTFGTLVEEGRNRQDKELLEHRRNLTTADDVSTLIYTGGGTYNRLTHKMLMHDIAQWGPNENVHRHTVSGSKDLCTRYGRARNYACQMAGHTVDYPLPGGQPKPSSKRGLAGMLGALFF